MRDWQPNVRQPHLSSSVSNATTKIGARYLVFSPGNSAQVSCFVMFGGWKPLCELQLISRAGRSLCVTLPTTAHSVGQQTAGRAALKASQVMQVAAEIRGRDNVHAPQWEKLAGAGGGGGGVGGVSLDGLLQFRRGALRNSLQSANPPLHKPVCEREALSKQESFSRHLYVTFTFVAPEEKCCCLKILFLNHFIVFHW